MFTEVFKRQMTTSLALLSLLIGTHSLWEESRLQERLTLMTPIVILDRTAILKGLPVSGDPVERERVTQNLKDLAARYAKEGFLVIDGGWVLGAPEDVYVH